MRARVELSFVLAGLVLLVPGCAGGAAGSPERPAGGDEPATLPPQVKATAITQFEAAVRRIDEALLRARVLRDEAEVVMLRYRRAFAVEVRDRLRDGRFRIVPVIPGHPPESDAEVLRTFGAAFEDGGRRWAALIEVPRRDNPELFALFRALDVEGRDG